MTTAPWIPRLSPTKRKARLFCLPPAGRGASHYYAWTRELADDGIDVVPVHLAGREDRLAEPAADRIADVVEPLADVLATRLDAPYAMWGHSMGAILAFETVRALVGRQAPMPKAVLLAACRAPHLPRRLRPIRALADAEFLDELRRRYGGMPNAASDTADARDAMLAELLKLMTPTLRADVTLVETYEYSEGGPLNCALVALGGRDDQSVTSDELAAWQDHTTGRFKHVQFPGGHFFADTQRVAVLRIIRQAMLGD